jgi:hypothetical protein
MRLQGGLGNQLFQYAAGRRIAHNNDTTLKLDISWFEKESPRRYTLNHFNIIENIASSREISLLKMSDNNPLNIARGLAERLKPYYKRSTIREKFYQFDPRILDVGPDAYLDGYWQSEKYFKDISEIIRREFTFKHEPEKENACLARHILETESVGIHIRRGDYACNPTINQVHGLCSLGYYSRAIEKLTDEISKPNFFVFSDDPQWARENLELAHPAMFVINNSNDKGYEDLRLLSLCKHHIIANSSFSWWGAWLSNNKDKMVFAPAKWFNSGEFDTRDLIPASWHKL